LPGDRPPRTHEAHVHEAATATDVVGGEVVSLDREAERQRLSVADQVTLQDASLRGWMANRVVPAFVWANGLTLGALGVLALLDEANIIFRLIAPGDRIVNHQVIMALLGATTVQVGVIAAIIARYLFPGGSSRGGDAT
jgi:hypothetical protein